MLYTGGCQGIWHNYEANWKEFKESNTAGKAKWERLKILNERKVNGN